MVCLPHPNISISSIFCQDLVEFVARQAAVYIVVDRHDRGQAARADAAACVQAELAVFRAFAARNMQFFLQLLVDLAAALYIARRAQANADFVFTLRTKAELRLKRGNSINFRQRFAQRIGHDTLHLDG